MESFAMTFFADIHPLAWMATGYALFLLMSACGLEFLARNTHRRSLRLSTLGFVYHQRLDTWECPQGQHLLPIAVDHERRRIYYRGNAQVCNHCPLKAACTDSEKGREIVRLLEPWPHSEIGRFHRGLSLALITLATLIVLTALGWHHRLHEALLLAGTLVCLALADHYLLRAFRASPANFPGT